MKGRADDEKKGRAGGQDEWGGCFVRAVSRCMLRHKSAVKSRRVEIEREITSWSRVVGSGDFLDWQAKAESTKKTNIGHPRLPTPRVKYKRNKITQNSNRRKIT